MAIKADFNLEDAFNFFDVDKRNILTAYDLKQALLDLKIYCTRDDIHTLISKYDEDRDGKLNRAEFGRMFSPSDPVSAQ